MFFEFNNPSKSLTLKKNARIQTREEYRYQPLPSAFRWSKRVHRERRLVSRQLQGEENAPAAHHLLQPPDTAAGALVPAQPIPGPAGAGRTGLQPGPNTDTGRTHPHPTHLHQYKHSTTPAIVAALPTSCRRRRRRKRSDKPAAVSVE